MKTSIVIILHLILQCILTYGFKLNAFRNDQLEKTLYMRPDHCSTPNMSDDVDRNDLCAKSCPHLRGSCMKESKSCRPGHKECRCTCEIPASDANEFEHKILSEAWKFWVWNHNIERINDPCVRTTGDKRKDKQFLAEKRAELKSAKKRLDKEFRERKRRRIFSDTEEEEQGDDDDDDEMTDGKETRPIEETREEKGKEKVINQYNDKVDGEKEARGSDGNVGISGKKKTSDRGKRKKRSRYSFKHFVKRLGISSWQRRSRKNKRDEEDAEKQKRKLETKFDMEILNHQKLYRQTQSKSCHSLCPDKTVGFCSGWPLVNNDIKMDTEAACFCVHQTQRRQTDWRRTALPLPSALVQWLNPCHPSISLGIDACAKACPCYMLALCLTADGEHHGNFCFCADPVTELVQFGLKDVKIMCSCDNEEATTIDSEAAPTENMCCDKCIEPPEYAKVQAEDMATHESISSSLLMRK